MNLKLKDGKEITLPSSDKAAAHYVADLFNNQGQLPDSDERLEWSQFAELISPHNQDLTRSSEITPLLQKSLEILIREPVEPSLVVTGLFNRVQSKGLSTQVLAGAMGAVYASDVQENGTYPEVMFQVGGAVSTAWIGKSGIAAAFTDEALRYSSWDIMRMNLGLMGKALARHKEQKAIMFLRALGVSLYDNATPADSLFGVCTGRNLAMAANGSCTTDDLFRAMAHMSQEGFAPDTLLMSPLFFFNWLQDPVLRAMLIAHGGGAMYNSWQGNPGPQAPWSNGAMGAMGPTNGQKLIPGGSASGETASALTEYSNQANSAPTLPSYLPWNLNIVVSPLLPFDPETQTGDIYLLSSGNVGYHLVDEDPTTVEWRDESTEVSKVKIRERYGFAIAHEGQGVGVFKNVKLARNYWDGTIEATTADVTAEIDPNASIAL